jgi:hypothetical protein
MTLSHSFCKEDKIDGTDESLGGRGFTAEGAIETRDGNMMVSVSWAYVYFAVKLTTFDFDQVFHGHGFAIDRILSIVSNVFFDQASFKEVATFGGDNWLFRCFTRDYTRMTKRKHSLIPVSIIKGDV